MFKSFDMYLWMGQRNKLINVSEYLLLFEYMSETTELSRGELIAWMNSMIKGNYNKVQQLGSGAAYCQLFQILYPGKLPLNRVNFKAKTQYEFICNLKLLQQSLHKASVPRQIDIEKLTKCKYQDNFELLQWFKVQFELHGKKSPEISVSTQNRREDSRNIAPVANTNRSNAENSQGSFQKANVSFEEVLVELNRPPPVDDVSLREERNFYLTKLKHIDLLVETWDRERPAIDLANSLKVIIGAAPNKIYNIHQGQLTQVDDDLI